MILEIPRVPSSPNYLRGKHWRVRWRESKLWNEEVGLAILTQKHRDQPYQCAQVTINRQSRGELDPDNLVASVKPVIDALTRNRLITDDSSEHIELEVRQVRKPTREKPCTLIEVEAI